MLMEFTYRFEAAHRFLKSESIPCMTPHGHSWQATMGVSFKGKSLNDAQMTVEFSKVKSAWRSTIQNTLDHSYMHNINDPIIEVLKQGSKEARLLPFPGDPTTELISLFLFEKMEKIVTASEFANDVEVSFIKVQETPTNSIHCDRDFYLSEIENFRGHTGWWQSLDPMDRSFRGTD